MLHNDSTQLLHIICRVEKLPGTWSVAQLTAAVPGREEAGEQSEGQAETYWVCGDR